MVLESEEYIVDPKGKDEEPKNAHGKVGGWKGINGRAPLYENVLQFTLNVYIVLVNKLFKIISCF